MLQVDATEFQKGVANYLKRIGNGEEIQIASKGRIVARVVPVPYNAASARQRLESLRGTVIVDDVLSPSDEQSWGADADHL